MSSNPQLYLIESDGLLSWPSVISGAIKIGPTRRPSGFLRCLVADLGSSVVLVEVGLGLFDWLAPFRRLGYQRLRAVRKSRAPFGLRPRLEARGISSDRVAHIVVTHGHLDNLGGLNDFPAATLHALPDANMQRHLVRFGEPSRRFTAPLSPATERNGFRLHRLDIPDVEFYLVELPGHAANHTGVLLRVEGETILYLGDAVSDLDELTEAPTPKLMDWLSLLGEQRPFERLRTSAKLRRFAMNATEPLRLITARGPTWQLLFGPPPRIKMGFL